MTFAEFLRNFLNIGSPAASASDRNDGRFSGTGSTSGDYTSNRDSFLAQMFGAIVGNLGGIIDNAVSTLDSSSNSAVGSLVNKFTGRALTGAEREANAFTAQQAQAQMNFQERMANTQYQRGVADMQAAGVNPALAMSQGGNVAPSGASGSSVQPNSGMSMSDLLQMFTLKSQLRLLDAQARKTNAEADKIGKETDWMDQLNTATVNQLNAAADLAKSEKDLNENERKALMAAQKVLAENQGKLASAQEFQQKWRNVFIEETGTDPGASVLSNVFSNAISNLAGALERLFPDTFTFNFNEYGTLFGRNGN